MLSSSNLKQNSNIMLLAFPSVGVTETLMVGYVLMTVATPANRDFPMAPSIPATPCCMKPFGNDPSDWPMSRNENVTSFHVLGWLNPERVARSCISCILSYWESAKLPELCPGTSSSCTFQIPKFGWDVMLSWLYTSRTSILCAFLWCLTHAYSATFP